MLLLFANTLDYGGNEEQHHDSLNVSLMMMNRSFSWEDWDGVMRNLNDSVWNPVDVNLFAAVVDIICCIIGLPFNFYMAATILCKKRLKKKAKNVVQLAIGFCDIFTLSMALIRIVYYFHPSEELCLVFVSIGGLTYLAFFLNLLLSLIDRYVAITRPSWHRSTVTVRFVILWQILLNLLLVLAVKWPHITQFVPLRCEEQFIHVATFQVIFITELGLCFAFHIAGYSKAKQLLRSSRSISVDGTKTNGRTAVRYIFKRRRHPQQKEIEMKLLNRAPSAVDSNKTQSTGSASAAADTPRITVHRSKERLALLETKATKTFLISVIPLLVLPCPLLLYSFSMIFICIPLYGDQCAHFAWLATYFKELITFHVLIYAIISVWRKKDFSLPLSCRWFKNTIDLEKLYG